jgi:Zn-dependent M28 family amino/carboxypeptidase
MKNALAGAVALYGNGLSSVVSGQLDASDHAPFEDLGFPACLLIEYNFRNNPYFHTAADSTDTPNYIDYAFATNMVSSTVGFLADSAVLIPEPATLLLLALGSVILRRKHRPNSSERSRGGLSVLE